MNFVSVSGTVGKAELKALQSGDTILSFSVADNQGRDKPPIWWNCSLWGKRADSLSQYITKGSKVTVVGQISEREYTDRDGNQKKVMEVRANDIALQGGKAEAEEKPVRQAKPVMAPDESEDLPF